VRCYAVETSEAYGKEWISCLSCDLAVPARYIGHPCPRCAARLLGRKPSSSERTFALVTAGLALYIPANVFAMSTDIQLGTRAQHRIVDGIEELFHARLWPLGVLIFCTSIAIPLLKLTALGWLLLSVRHHSTSALVFKTKLYRVIDEIGRWSNEDVFTIVVFLPLINFAPLASAHADTGATAFLLVVVLTLFAVRAFDARELWDAQVKR
jgi:paraquat-inducible protein A